MADNVPSEGVTPGCCTSLMRGNETLGAVACCVLHCLTFRVHICHGKYCDVLNGWSFGRFRATWCGLQPLVDLNRRNLFGGIVSSSEQASFWHLLSFCGVCIQAVVVLGCKLVIGI